MATSSLSSKIDPTKYQYVRPGVYIDRATGKQVGDNAAITGSLAGHTPAPTGSTNTVPVASSMNIGPTRDAIAAQLPPAQQAALTSVNQTNDNEYRGDQRSLIAELQGQANGTGPSIAGAQFRSATDRNIAQQMALAASMRGNGNALAGRQAMTNAASMNQDFAQQSGIQRLAEQIQAQQELAGVINQGRSSDENIAMKDADLANTNSQFNAQQGNQVGQAQGALGNATSLANAGSTNQARIAQAQINEADDAAKRYSAAQVGAAQASAAGNVNAAKVYSTQQYINLITSLMNQQNGGGAVGSTASQTTT